MLRTIVWGWLTSWFWPERPGRDDPFDHDKNKLPGGSLPASERGLDDLRAKYEIVTGRKPDRRWGAKTLEMKIELNALQHTPKRN